MAQTPPVLQSLDDPVFRRLDRALRLELEDRPLRSIAIGSLAHLPFGLPLLWVALVAPQSAPQPAPREILTQIFVPPPAPRAHSNSPPNLLRGKSEAVRAEERPVSIAPVAVDLSAVRLSFRPDVRNQLPAVVATQGGVLALLDKENPTIARYVFRPPLWRAEEVTVDVTGRLRLLMDPPQQWPVFREVASREGLDLNSFLACAMFDIGYRRCLQKAIRDRVPPDSSGRVSAASLEFSADEPCGVEVLNVSLASNSPAGR